MKKLYIFILTVLLLLPLSLIGTNASDNSIFENKSTHYYTISDGLPSNQINDIATTSNGLIWLGGYSALTKFDGSTFTSYSQSGDISIKNIMSLASDKDDLYIGTQSGLIKYDGKQFEKINLGAKYKVSSINVSKDYVLLGTNNGLLSLKKSDKTVSTITNSPIMSITSYMDDRFFYINESKELYIYYEGQNQRIVTTGFEPKTVVNIGDSLYMGGYDGSIYVRNLTNSTQKTYTISDKPEINDFYQLNNSVYIGAKNGLYVLNNDTITYANDISLEDIGKITSDYQGNIWISSTSSGIAKVYSTVFENIFTKYNLYNNPDITSYTVNAYAIYKNKYYIGTGTQLIELDPNTNTVKILIKARIRGLKEQNGKLYIATYNSNVYDLAVYDGANLSNITGFYLAGDEGESNAGKVRCLDTYGDYIIVGTNYGISLVKNDTVVKTIKLANEPLSIYCNNNRIYACIDVTSVNIYDFELNLKDSISVLESSPLKCIVVDNTLLYSENAALIAIDLTTKESKEIQLTANANGSITDIFEANGKIYLSTSSCELFIINKSDILSGNPKVTTLGISNGFTGGSTANGSGYYDSTSNTYYFSTSSGVLSLDLSSTVSNSIPLKMVINKILVDDKTYSVNEVISIGRNTSRITIDFSIVSFLEGKKKTVCYKLDGVDQDFVEADGTTNEVSYTNLSGGTYNFHIYVIDETGNTTSETINFSIVKDFQVYEQAWFWVVISISTLAVLFLIIFLYVRSRINKANEMVKLQRGITREAIIAIATSIDAKDKYTNGHSIRVGEYSKIIAENMGYKGVELENIYYIALLHDVGKIGVPDNVLNKPARLTDEEFEIIKTHTVVGAEILKNITTIPNIIEGAKYHHEKYDGSGYPEKLKGEDIPLISRIICAADCYDAMATKRVYKPPFDKEKIISEFKRCSGTQFDPNIAELMVKLIEEGKIYPIDAEKEIINKIE